MREGHVGKRLLCFVWCEECCNRHWDRTNGLAKEGRMVSKSGTLKVCVHCESCWDEHPVGEEATAFTIDGGPVYLAWEHHYLDLYSESAAENG
jgi:hypothetical protein